MKLYYSVLAVCAAACLLLFPQVKAGAEAGGGACGGIAAKLGAYALANGLYRLAVLDFVPGPGAGKEEAAYISGAVSDCLYDALAASPEGRVRLEDALARDRRPAPAWRQPDEADLMRNKLSADAAVTGSVAAYGGGLRIQARLTDLKTGQVLLSVQSGTVPEPVVFRGPLVELPWRPAPSPWRARGEAGAAGLRDAVSDAGQAACAGQRAALWRLNARLAEKKARYWAAKMREPGFSTGAPGRNPGIELGPPAFQKLFYALLAAYLAAEPPRGLAAGEVKEINDLLEVETGFATRCGFR